MFSHLLFVYLVVQTKSTTRKEPKHGNQAKANQTHVRIGNLKLSLQISRKLVVEELA